MIHSPLHGGLNLGYFLLDINSNKTLSWPPTVQPSQSNKNIQSQAIKTASLDHITAKCSLLQPSRVPLVPLWNKLEWRERNPVACAVRKGKKKEKEGEREPDENWQPTVSVMPSTRLLVEPDALACQLTSYKHSTTVQRPLPRKLSLLNSCVIAGPWPKGCLVPRWSGAGGWSG